YTRRLRPQRAPVRHNHRSAIERVTRLRRAGVLFVEVHEVRVETLGAPLTQVGPAAQHRQKVRATIFDLALRRISRRRVVKRIILVAARSRSLREPPTQTLVGGPL